MKVSEVPLLKKFKFEGATFLRIKAQSENALDLNTGEAKNLAPETEVMFPVPRQVSILEGWYYECNNSGHYHSTEEAARECLMAS